MERTGKLTIGHGTPRVPSPLVGEGREGGREVARCRCDFTNPPPPQPLPTRGRGKKRSIIHRVFAPAQFNVTIPDRFGNPVKPREWFLVPLSAIDEAIEKIKDGSIIHFEYDPQTASLKKIEAAA